MLHFVAEAPDPASPPAIEQQQPPPPAPELDAPTSGTEGEDVAPPTEPTAEQPPKGFRTLVAPDTVPDSIPPPATARTDTADFTGEGAARGRAAGGDPPTAGDLTRGPVATPHTVAPQLLNPEEVQREQLARWPRTLRRAGIGGQVDLWVLLDSDGKVVKALLHRSSGRETLDRAAQEVVPLMRFRPAEYLGQPVSVWIVVPLEFRMH